MKLLPIFIALGLGLVIRASETVDSLDTSKYVGRWYQVTTDEFNSVYIEEGACTTADYALQSDGTIAVVNSENIGDTSGEFSQITGYAYVVDSTEPGQLKVHLEGVPVDGDYWVLELGPATYGDEGYYQYAIVSDSKSASLFVLARDVDTYYSEYDAHVSASLEAKGFNESYNSPIPLSHEGCTYSEYAYAASGVATNPDTVGQLVVDEYLGRWYQMYASPSVYATFESNATCVTADYGLNENGTISVYNVDSEGSPSGPYEIINGYAYQINAEIEPGKLVVHFDTSPTDAPYWILALGPANADGLYDWSVVSDPLEATLFILARDVETFRTEYEDDVLALVEDLGFTKDYNKPVETVQDGCTYIEEPSA